jgi:hypothetical protein
MKGLKQSCNDANRKDKVKAKRVFREWVGSVRDNGV